MSDNIYRTSDLYLAAWLLSRGLVLQDIDRSDTRRLGFVFEDSPDRVQLVHEFECGRATANVSDFIYQLRRAKRLLYADRNGE